VHLLQSMFSTWEVTLNTLLFNFAEVQLSGMSNDDHDDRIVL
jgi:hypothetical protein